jgi:Tfp pilus assembly protein PilF
MPRAKAAAQKAARLESRSAQSHLALGLVQELYDWDWARARQALRLAVDLEPGNATALFEYGFFLSRMGEPDEAFAAMRRARELDPLSPVINTNLGVNFYYQRNFTQAIHQYQEALELDPSYLPAHYRLALAHLCRGMVEEARRLLETGMRQSGATPSLLALYGCALARSGCKDRARGILEALLASSAERYVSPVSIAILHLGMNESAHALDWLEHARDEHDVLLVDIKVDPVFDSLRVKPAFRDLLHRLDLEGGPA